MWISLGGLQTADYDHNKSLIITSWVADSPKSIFMALGHVCKMAIIKFRNIFELYEVPNIFTFNLVATVFQATRMLKYSYKMITTRWPLYWYDIEVIPRRLGSNIRCLEVHLVFKVLARYTLSSVISHLWPPKRRDTPTLLSFTMDMW